MVAVAERENEHKVQSGHIRKCGRCGVVYDWRKSTSFSLKMTYCSTLCEKAAEGFLLERYLKDDVHRLLEDVKPEDAFPEIEIGSA